MENVSGVHSWTTRTEKLPEKSKEASTYIIHLSKYQCFQPLHLIYSADAVDPHLGAPLELRRTMAASFAHVWYVIVTSLLNSCDLGLVITTANRRY
jgi:hypothetical protein